MNAVIRSATTTELVQRPVPTPGPGEILVEIHCAGICRTDLYAASGALPVQAGRVLGHELAGAVVRSDGSVPVGARVTAVPGRSCGTCPECALFPERCAYPALLGLDLDGAFADFVVLPAASAVVVPGSLSDEEVAFVEPLAAAMAPLTAIAKTDRVGVVGRGRIGSLLARVIETATGRAPLRLDDHPSASSALDVVVETAPDAVSLDLALRALRPGGKLVLKSRPFERVPFDLRLAVQKELSLVGARYAPFRDAVTWLAEERVAVRDLFGGTAPLDRFADSFTRAATAHAPKLFLAPGSG
jgi:threonine dehydrogenase-like Zn-dependent dehydrogenase